MHHVVRVETGARIGIVESVSERRQRCRDPVHPEVKKVMWGRRGAGVGVGNVKWGIGCCGGWEWKRGVGTE